MRKFGRLTDCKMAEKDDGKTPTEVNAESAKESEDLVDSEKPHVCHKLEAKRVHYVTAIPECVVCLQPCHHPVKLSCGHIFCFLCVKGVAARSHRCALCRAEVLDDYFENPVVVSLKGRQDNHSVGHSMVECNTHHSYKWFYEGRNGWWQYEDRASNQIEDAFSEGKQTIEIPIAGFGYIIDIENMVQYRKNYPTRRRRIKRDKLQADKKGVAGLKYTKDSQHCEKYTFENTESKQDLTARQINTEKQESEDSVMSLTEKFDTTL